MVKFEELEKEISQSKEKFSLMSDESKKTYTIFSEKLKQSLRDGIYSVAGKEWKVKSMGENFVEYFKEQNDKIGFYRKNLVNGSPDEFVIKAKKEKEQSLIEKIGNLPRQSIIEERRTEIEERRTEIEERRTEIEERRTEIEERRNRIEEFRQGVSDCSSSNDKASISFIAHWKDGVPVEHKIVKKYSDPSELKEIKESWTYAAVRGAFEMIKEEQEKKASSQSQGQQQAQIQQKEQPKFPNPQDKGGNK